MKEVNKRIPLKEEDVKRRLKDLDNKLKDLDINLEKLELTWDSFLHSIIIDYTKQTLVKFKGNYLIPYTHYLESKLNVHERIDDKIDINYINDLEKRFLPIKKRKKEKKLEFKVNDFLTLKLENNTTFIYIKGKRFIQCKRLLLQIPPQESNLYEEIESIDEAIEVFKQTLWNNRIVEGPMARPSSFQNKTITPEQEFWGHCSNLQAWYEHNYDTCLLHSNLSFPLLKTLTDAGDPNAKAVFEEEIAIRFESGYPTVVNYLLEQGYLRYLDKDQLKTLFETVRFFTYCENCGTQLPDPNPQFCPNCGIPFKHLFMINSLKKENRNIAWSVIKGRQIIYTSDNWDISGDVDRLLSSWSGQIGQNIVISEVKYFIQQLEAERLVALSYMGEGGILAEKDDDYIIIIQWKLKLKKTTILVVNDEPDILNLMVKFLKIGDFDTITSNNLKEAMKKLEENYDKIALILIDSMMKGLNSKQFLQNVKSDERYKHVLVKFWSYKPKL